MSAKVLSSGSSPALGVDHEEDEIGLADGDLGLRAHAALQGLGRRILEAGRVDHVEIEVVEAGRMDAAVAGDARRVVDQRQLAGRQDG